MRGVYDYLLEDYYDADRFDSVRDYFYRRHMAFSECSCDECLAEDSRNALSGKKSSQTRVASQDGYDVIAEQERKDARDLERRIHRKSIFGSYIPSVMERDF